MKVKECIDKFDELYPNGISEDTKVKWLSDLDKRILIDVIQTHEGGESAVAWDIDNVMAEMLVPSPYDELYVKYLQMKTDEANQETERYNNSATFFNAYYDDYARWYHRNNRPLRCNGFNIWRH